jgi:Fe-S cluster assembly iron-binding protein IscA
MLAISPAASAAISKALQGVSLPDGAGLRFATVGRTERGIAIEITFVMDAAPHDYVVDIDAPAGVFLEPAAAKLLNDQVLDADTDEDGRLTFSLRPQTAGGAGSTAA